MKTRLILFPVAIMTTLAGAALAGDSPRSDANAARSLTSGMARSDVPILERKTGLGREAVLNQLLPSLGKSPTSRNVATDRVRAKGDGWHLDVFADGSMVEFADETAEGRLHAQGVSAASTIAPGALETAARAYVAKNLAGAIDLQPGEALVMDMTSARTDGGMRVDGTPLPTTTVANRIVFRREIDGVPVVGNGSKVILTFLNDGSLHSFRYDWPRYVKTGRTQAAAAPGDILQRVQRAVGARTQGVAQQAVIVPQNATASTKVDLGSDMQLHRLDCGYYDPGVLVREAGAPIQSGCFYHAVHVASPSASGTASSAAAAPAVLRSGVSGAVPAAVQPEADGRWPEERLLRGVLSSAIAPPPSAPPATRK